MRFRWTGTEMVPLVPRVAADRFTPGEAYFLEPWEPASQASRGHYFASLKTGWENLPEQLAERFPTPEHLRKYLLIRAGYRDERTIVAASNAQAQRIAGFVRPMDEFAVVTVREATVIVYTAKSQSARAMGKAAFQRSKSDVLDALAALIGVERQALDQNAGQAA